jgi:hypothetical protein
MYARIEFVVAVLVVLFAAFLYIAAPQTGGMRSPDSGLIRLTDVLLVLGVAGMVIGFGWMIRIYRADPEPDQRSWRYRSRR